MDILDALGALEGAVITKEKELAAVRLAQQVLQDRFAPEFLARDEAVGRLAEKQDIINGLTAERDSLSTEKSALESENDSLRAEIAAGGAKTDEEAFI